MKAIFIILFIFQITLFFSQENDLRICKVKFQIDTTGLINTGILKLQFTNLESHKLKIPKNFDMMRIQAQNTERFDSNLNEFVNAKNTFVDVNCPKCNEKLIKIKSNERFEYNIKLTELYLVGKILSERNTKFRFNLFFDNIDFRYKQNKKCFIEDYESPKIIYITK